MRKFRNNKSSLQPLSSAPPASQRRILVAGIFGNLLEWFDFAIYGLLATFIARNIFPSSDPLSDLLAVYGAFAAGYLSRPLGSLFFGHFSDRYGRKYVLIASILLMGLCTLSIGLLPTYDQIGVASGVILVILRILQGLSVGGEFSSSIAFIAENAPAKRRGLTTSFAFVGSTAGFLMGSALCTVLTNIYTDEQITNWAWRIPFLAGGVIMLVGLYLRQSLLRIALDTAPPIAGPSPVIVAFRSYWPNILRIMFLVAPMTINFYVMFAFSVSFLIDEVGMTSSLAYSINTVSLLILLLTIPVGGWLADRIEPKWVLFACLIALLIGAYPLFWLFDHDSAWLAISGQAGFAVINGISAGVAGLFLVQSVPKKVRASVIATGYNTGVAVFGGTAPALVTYLIQTTGNDMAPVILMLAFVFAGMVAVISVSKTYAVAADSN